MNRSPRPGGRSPHAESLHLLRISPVDGGEPPPVIRLKRSNRPGMDKSQENNRFKLAIRGRLSENLFGEKPALIPTPTVLQFPPPCFPAEKVTKS